MIVGFIGLGVMGEPMCRNLASRGGLAVRGYDRDPAPLQRLAEQGVVSATSVREAAEHASTIFLSLPSGRSSARFARVPAASLASFAPGRPSSTSVLRR